MIVSMERPAVATEAFRFTLAATPRTKKTSNRIIRFGRNKEHVRVLPSEAFMEFQERCLLFRASIHRTLRMQGATLPIAYPVTVKAIFYREADRGDWCGFATALGDVLQEMGVLANDVWIRSWDGTRLAKDARFSRVEIWITPFSEGELF